MKPTFETLATNRSKLNGLLALRQEKQQNELPKEVQGLKVQKILFGERTDTFNGLEISLFTTFSYLGKSKNKKNGKTFHHVQAWAGGKKYVLIFGN